MVHELLSDPNIDKYIIIVTNIKCFNNIISK